jgi:hypothetical protein
MTGPTFWTLKCREALPGFLGRLPFIPGEPLDTVSVHVVWIRLKISSSTVSLLNTSAPDCWIHYVPAVGSWWSQLWLMAASHWCSSWRWWCDTFEWHSLGYHPIHSVVLVGLSRCATLVFLEFHLQFQSFFDCSGFEGGMSSFHSDVCRYCGEYLCHLHDDGGRCLAYSRL